MEINLKNKENNFKLMFDKNKFQYIHNYVNIKGNINNNKD